MPLLISLLLLAPATAAEPAVADPFAMLAGKIECANPDPQKRVCDAIGDFPVDGKGRVTSRNRAIIEGGEPPLIMTSLYPVEQRGDRLCFTISADSVAATRFERGGQPDDGPAAAERRAQLADMLRPLFGKSLCERYLPADAPTRAEVSVDGVLAAEHDRAILWVDADAGWALRAPE